MECPDDGNFTAVDVQGLSSFLHRLLHRRGEGFRKRMLHASKEWMSLNCTWIGGAVHDDDSGRIEIFHKFLRDVAGPEDQLVCFSVLAIHIVP